MFSIFDLEEYPWIRGQLSNTLSLVLCHRWLLSRIQTRRMPTITTTPSEAPVITGLTIKTSSWCRLMPQSTFTTGPRPGTPEYPQTFTTNSRDTAEEDQWTKGKFFFSLFLVPCLTTVGAKYNFFSMSFDLATVSHTGSTRSTQWCCLFIPLEVFLFAVHYQLSLATLSN